MQQRCKSVNLAHDTFFICHSCFHANVILAAFGLKSGRAERGIAYSYTAASTDDVVVTRCSTYINVAVKRSIASLSRYLATSAGSHTTIPTMAQPTLIWSMHGDFDSVLQSALLPACKRLLQASRLSSSHWNLGARMSVHELRTRLSAMSLYESNTGGKQRVPYCSHMAKHIRSVRRVISREARLGKLEVSAPLLCVMVDIAVETSQSV